MVIVTGPCGRTLVHYEIISIPVVVVAGPCGRTLVQTYHLWLLLQVLVGGPSWSAVKPSLWLLLQVLVGGP